MKFGPLRGCFDAEAPRLGYDVVRLSRLGMARQFVGTRRDVHARPRPVETIESALVRGPTRRRASMRNVLLVCICLVTSNAEAIEGPGETRTLPCRPTIACTADIVPPGAFELEAGALFRRIEGNGRQWTFPFLAKLTVAEWAQLQFGSNGYSIARGGVTSRFMDDVTPGVKLHLVDQGDLIPSVSISASASIPTFRASGYVRTYDTLFTGYLTKDVGWLHADFNVGLDVWRLQDPRPQAWVALALSGSPPPPFGLMIEGYYFTDAGPIATRDGGLLFAISHSPKPWLMFDVGGDAGYFPSARALSVFVGMSIVPALLWATGPRKE
jgi:hypothetical protein